MPLHGSGGSFDALFAGDYALGNSTYASNQSLTGDVYYDNLTINNSIVVQTNGFGIFVRNTLTLGDGVVINDTSTGNGNNASGLTPGSAGTNKASGTTGGSWYSAAAGGTGLGGNATVLGPSIGIHMGGGGGGGGGAGNGTIGANSGGFGARGGYDGGGGGDGAISPGLPGGPGGINTPETQASAVAKTGYALNIQALITGHVAILGTLYPLYGGNGGGGGGGDGVAEAGGGGGAGGGVVRVVAREIIRSGVGTAPIIRANGGDGGAGQTPDGGGGGGGGGGLVMVGYGQIDLTIVLQAHGGAGGTPGSNGGAGGAGASGRIYKYQF